jgi:hexokinase
MAMIEEASSLTEVKQLLVNQLEVSDLDAVSDQDAAIVKWVCEQIGTRAARLCGSAIAAVLIQSGHARLGGGFSDGEGKLVMAAAGKCVVLCLFSGPDILSLTFG